MAGDPLLALQDRDPDALVAQRQLAGDREPDDAGADDDDVALARRGRVGRLGSGHRIHRSPQLRSKPCRCR
jgi:hypothetical protein